MSVLKVNMTFRNSAVYATVGSIVLKLNRYKISTLDSHSQQSPEYNLTERSFVIF